MNFTEFRLKWRHFFRKNKRILIIALLVWSAIFFINIILKNQPKDFTPEVSFEKHTSVINPTKDTPKNLQKPIEELINEYVEYCNSGNFQKAYDMLSEDCKKYAFNNDIKEFMQHVYTKIPTPKVHAIQSYSSVKYGNRNMYIYQIKYTEDLLATGLTDSDYYYTQENMVFYQNKDQLEMNVGNYLYHEDIKSISENEYLKIDIIDRVVNYSIETYEVKFTNRSNYTIVVSDGEETEEVLISLLHETRGPSNPTDLVLKPKETAIVKYTFPKFVDDNDITQNLIFSSIRVMENYSGTEDVPKETIQSEIDNAIAKFSMEINVAK